MQIKQLIEDEDAVSPVIGVILMVAITVILAAVIGTFVLGLGDQVQNNAPQAQFTFDFNDNGGTGDCTTTGWADDGSAGNLTVTHDGGDKISGSDLSLSVEGNTQEWQANCGGSTDVTAGNSVIAGTASGEQLRVVWQAGQGNSATLGKWNGPDA